MVEVKDRLMASVGTPEFTAPNGRSLIRFLVEVFKNLLAADSGVTLMVSRLPT